jgi:hypothetical protein
MYPSKPERLKERHEKRNGSEIRIRQKRIFEVNFKGRGVRVSALDMRFPKHESKSADAYEHDDYLKKYRRASFCRWRVTHVPQLSS